MNLEQIKTAIANGQKVHWANTGYEVIKDSIGQYLIRCTMNGHCIGLTWRDGVTLNGKPAQFFIAPSITMRAFFELPEIRAAQETQKQNRVDSPAHRKAYAVMLRTARKYHAAKFFGDYL